MRLSPATYRPGSRALGWRSTPNPLSEGIPIDSAPVPEAERVRLAEAERSRDFLARLYQTTPWGTWLIIALCGLVYGGATLAGGTTKTMVLLRFGANDPPLVHGGEWWRLYGSAFLHIGLLHIAVDMFALWQVGPTCERLFGNLRFLALYSVAGLCGALASLQFSASIGAGASGAIFGLFGAILVLGWRRREELPPRLAHRLVRAMVPVIGYNLLFGFGFNGLSHGNMLIDNAAHLGGLLGGMAFALAVPPAVSERRMARAGILLPLLVLLAAAPFANEVVVGYRAARWSGVAGMPTRWYRDPQGRYALPYPALLTVEVKDDSTAFVGPGMVMVIDVFHGLPDAATSPPVDVLRAAVQQQGMKQIASVQEVVEAGRRWLLIRGRLDGNRKAQFSFLFTKGRVYRILLLSEAADFPDALQMLPAIQRGFSPGP